MSSHLKTFAGILFFVPLFLTSTASAATFGFGETFTLPTSSTVEGNAYLAGGTLLVSGPITGGMVAAGGNTTFSGVIEGDVLIAAGSSEVLGKVSGNFRGISGTLTVADSIGGDISVVGGSISLIESSHILHDALIVGGKISSLGVIEGDAYFVGGDIFIDGPINGEVVIYSGGDVHLGAHAVVEGDFSYHAAHEALIDQGAVVKGKTHFTYSAPVVSAPDARGFFAGLFGLLFFVRLLVLMITGLFFVLVFRRASTAFVHEAQGNFGKFALIGLVVLVSVPFAAFILALTVLGGLVSIFCLIVWFLLLVIAQVYTGVLAASFFRTYILKKPLEPVVPWYMAVLGILGVNIICLIPYVGLFVFFILFLASLGAISALGYRHFLTVR